MTAHGRELLIGNLGPVGRRIAVGTRRSQNNALLIVAIGVLLVAATQVTSAAEQYALTEDATDQRIFRVEAQLEVSGNLFTQPGPEKALKLMVNARFAFDERRREGAGREAQAFRSVRHYEQAMAAIEAGTQLSNYSLRDRLRLIVAQGEAGGVELFSPSGPLTYDELELLRTPGDCLAMLTLLPDSKVEIGESWQPSEWVMALLSGVEAAEKSSLKCKLDSVEKSTARVTVTGSITGAVLGASATISIEGFFLYDLGRHHIRRIELTQTEKRSIGTVSPGLDVSAKVAVTRTMHSRPQRLTDRNLDELPLDSNDANRLLMFDAPAWNVRFYHDRRWHLFHQSSEAAILRLLDKGGLIAQCNIKKLPDAAPGRHVAQGEFKADIQRTLGKDFQEFAQDDTLKLREGLFVYRVVAVGTVTRANDKKEPVANPMQWHYYLVANDEGRQLAFVFTVDPKLIDDLDSRDLSIVGGLEFFAPPDSSAPAGK
ncbi:MAG: hypothetical protein EXS05_18945 [Planctomycetaceae bacterium]|nr:hypothetical protein [Planctomycetaceae bacterium]